MKRTLQSKIRFLLILLSFTTFFLNSKANNPTIIGSNFSYTQSGTVNVYNITAKIFRDCSGPQLCANCPTNLSPTCAIVATIYGNSPGYMGVNYGTANLTVLTAISGFDVAQLCPNQTTICSNCGSRTPGSATPGVEVYTFTGQINLSSLPSNLCEVKVAFRIGKRIANANAIINPSAYTFYSEFIINRCVTPNSSPVFTNDPIFSFASNQDAVINLGAIDPDGDSLSYAIAPSLDSINVLTGLNNLVIYSPGFSGESPFPYLGILQGPNAPYPAGIHINQLTGDILFRPIGTFTEYLRIAVTQWRKVNGVITRLGVTNREILIYVKNATNYAPNFVRSDTLEQNKIPVENPFGDSLSLCHGQTWCNNLVQGLAQ